MLNYLSKSVITQPATVIVSKATITTIAANGRCVTALMRNEIHRIERRDSLWAVSEVFSEGAAQDAEEYWNETVECLEF